MIDFASVHSSAHIMCRDAHTARQSNKFALRWVEKLTKVAAIGIAPDRHHLEDAVLRSVDKYPIRFLLQRLVPEPAACATTEARGISTGVNSGGTRRTQIPVLQVLRRIHIAVVMRLALRTIPLPHRERRLRKFVAASRTHLAGREESRRRHQMTS